MSAGRSWASVATSNSGKKVSCDEIPKDFQKMDLFNFLSLLLDATSSHANRGCTDDMFGVNCNCHLISDLGVSISYPDVPKAILDCFRCGFNSSRSVLQEFHDGMAALKEKKMKSLKISADLMDKLIQYTTLDSSFTFVRTTEDVSLDGFTHPINAIYKYRKILVEPSLLLRCNEYMATKHSSLKDFASKKHIFRNAKYDIYYDADHTDFTSKDVYGTDHIEIDICVLYYVGN